MIQAGSGSVVYWYDEVQEHRKHIEDNEHNHTIILSHIHQAHLILEEFARYTDLQVLKKVRGG